MKTSAAILAALALVGAPSILRAQEPETETPDGAGGAAANVLGAWSFRNTGPYDGDCAMGGSLTLEETPVRNVYKCEMTAFETCEGHTTRAVQVCYAARNGAQLSIKAQVMSVEGLRPGHSYLPDDFVLSIKHDALMIGELRSADIADVEFTRVEELVS